MDHGEYKRIIPGADTALLFIHGICGTPRHFDFLLEHVPFNVSVWSLLLPGHGGSIKDFSRSSMSQWRAAVEQALGELCRSHTQVLVVGHSMGTLLALENAIEHPGRIEGLFLLASPLCIKFGPRAMKNSLHTAFVSSKKDGPVERAARDCCGTALSRNPLDYLGWLPRYLELFALSKKVRKMLPELKKPCNVYQSQYDELVSLRSVKYLKNAEIHILENSMHYYYSEDDRRYLQSEFNKFIKKEEAR